MEGDRRNLLEFRNFLPHSMGRTIFCDLHLIEGAMTPAVWSKIHLQQHFALIKNSVTHEENAWNYRWMNKSRRKANAPNEMKFIAETCAKKKTSSSQSSTGGKVNKFPLAASPLSGDRVSHLGPHTWNKQLDTIKKPVPYGTTIWWMTGLMLTLAKILDLGCDLAIIREDDKETVLLPAKNNSQCTLPKGGFPSHNGRRRRRRPPTDYLRDRVGLSGWVVWEEIAKATISPPHDQVVCMGLLSRGTGPGVSISIRNSACVGKSERKFSPSRSVSRWIFADLCGFRSEIPTYFQSPRGGR